MANIARSLVLEGQWAEDVAWMVRAASGEDPVVLQLAQGMLMSLATSGAAGASEALAAVAELRRELDPRLAE